MIKIGIVIKELRTKNHFTQDALATAIGVTPQAISRWEAEGGYPDIELLPLIADFFSVSIDELLGYRMSEREKHLGDIRKEMSRLEEVGTIEEQIDFARGALTEYPADYQFRENLATCLYCKYTDTKDESVLEEAESLALYVAEHCRDERIRYNAVITLIGIYADTKNTDKALAMVNRLSPMKYCREFAKSSGIGDGKSELYRQDEIDKLTDCLGTAISALPLNGEAPNDPSTWDKKIRMLEISNELYELIYGENLMFYHCRLAHNYWLISTYQAARGKTEETLASLEKMCGHAVAYDESYKKDHGKFYTSILVDKLIYPEPGREFHELTQHSQSWYMLDHIKASRYDAVRDEKRFAQIVKELSQYAW